jgi:hypothetical protein
VSNGALSDQIIVIVTGQMVADANIMSAATEFRAISVRLAGDSRTVNSVAVNLCVFGARDGCCYPITVFMKNCDNRITSPRVEMPYMGRNVFYLISVRF